MNDVQKRRFERLMRGVSFCEARASEFPETSKGGQSFARLKTILAEIENLDASRATNARVQQQGTSVKQDERTALRKHLAAISDTAETIGLDFPEVKGSFQRPRANTNDQTLLSAARSFLSAATPLKKRFVEYDMPDDFLERLGASITNFEQAIGKQTLGTGARVAANASLEDALGRGEQELERLDTSVRNKFRDDAATIVAWESARHLERPRRAKNNGGTQSNPPAPDAPSQT